MKYKMLNHTNIFLKFALVILMATSFSYAQTKKQNDSIINTIALDIYKNPDNSIKQGKLILAKSGNDIDFKINVYTMISSAYSSKRDYENALQYLIKANQFSKQTKNDLLKIKLINQMGILYHQLKVYDKAIQYLDQSEQLMLGYPYKDSIHSVLGRNYIVRGFIYKDKLSVDIAIDFFNKGILELNKSKFGSENSALSIAKYNRGNCYLFLLDDTLANENFRESFEHAKIINAKSLQAFALKGMAKVYTYEGKFLQSNETLKEALTLSANVNDLVLNNEIYRGLSENYLALNQLDNFTLYHTKQLAIDNEIKNNERKSISESLNEKEISLRLQLEKETYTFYIIMASIIIICILTMILILMLIRKKEVELKKLNIRIQDLQNAKRI